MIDGTSALKYRPEDIAWEPQAGPQTALLACTVPDILFGGARGGGKTDGILGDWLQHAWTYRHRARGILFRQTYPELEEVERRTLEIFPLTGGRYKSQKRTWIWPHGATLKLRYLLRDKHAGNYQGHSYTWMAFDELTRWASSRPIDELRACLRSAHGVPCVVRNTANPGGPGHNWVKARYLEPSPAMLPFWARDEKSGATVQRVYIPSRLEHNVKLTTSDPQYWTRVALAAHGRQDLLQAWRWGNWDIVAGGMFDDLWIKEVHVCPPFPIPYSWEIDRGHDWGSSAPFCTLWFAESDGTEATLKTGQKFTVPRGTLFVIGEDYGSTGRPNEGLRLTNAEIAQRMVRAETTLGIRERCSAGPADTSIFDVVDGHSIAETYSLHGVDFEPAAKGAGSRITGWANVRDRLYAAHTWPMEQPGLFIFQTCRHTLRTLPVLARDEGNPDDTDPHAEDHPGDVIRYRITKKTYSAGMTKFA